MILIVLVLHALFVCFFTGVHCQVKLEESGGRAVTPGASLQLNCKATGFDFGPGGYAMNWVRQQPGKGLEWVAYHYTGSGGTNYIYYSPSVQGRFTISRDVPQRLLHLDMKNVKTEDTGTYYCARDPGFGGYYFDAWGPGTYVTVTSATPSGPSVYPVSPCCDVQKSQDPLKIGCFVTADSPSDNIQWFLGSSQISSGVTQYPEVYSNGRYSLSSVLNLKSADWNDKSYECRFGTQKKPVQKRGCKEDCPNKIPKIELYMASCEPDDPKNMYLFCDLSDFAPEDIEVAWFRGTSTVTDFITIGNVTEVNKCSFHTSSKLKLVPEDWSNGMEYKCLATHSTKSVEKKISSCTA
nr:IgX/IgW heavy chain short form [Protopterus aethiopicus]